MHYILVFLELCTTIDGSYQHHQQPHAPQPQAPQPQAPEPHAPEPQAPPQRGKLLRNHIYNEVTNIILLIYQILRVETAQLNVRNKQNTVRNTLLF